MVEFVHPYFSFYFYSPAPPSFVVFLNCQKALFVAYFHTCRVGRKLGIPAMRLDSAMATVADALEAGELTFECGAPRHPAAHL